MGAGTEVVAGVVSAGMRPGGCTDAEVGDGVGSGAGRAGAGVVGSTVGREVANRVGVEVGEPKL